MNKGVKLIVFPVKDIEQATKLYTTFLGVEPYMESPYYVGYKAGDTEVGLDPHGQSAGPLVYTDVDDINQSIQELVAAGAQIQQEPRDVGAGLLIATLKDADGNTIGLRQKSN